ncbi:hypothetical protein [Paenibacillus sp. 32352]|uniref:hypothetical protein n=1 Tax=Paenibacillus sp. 32352 TaxID=1969111 RepID=UPI0009AE2EA0|nr:hypothetical protein [Paenibacillus sp. 32352]
MPRIYRQSSFHEYHHPNPKDGRIIEMVSLETHDQIFDIVYAPYTDKGFSTFIYSVVNSRLSTYHDELFASFIEGVLTACADLDTGITAETNVTYQELVKCLCFIAIKSPFVTAQEFKFFRGQDLLGGAGVFSLISSYGLIDKTLRDWLGKLAQYQLESLNPCLRLIVAITQPDGSWQLAHGRINVHKDTNKNYASVRFEVFNPKDLVDSLFSGKTKKDTPHYSFDSIILLAGDMSFYKNDTFIL